MKSEVCDETAAKDALTEKRDDEPDDHKADDTVPGSCGETIELQV